MKVVSVKPSTRANKRYMATFSNGVVTHFGDPERPSYPMHKDRDRKRRYMLRHIKDLNTRDPTRAGYLSWYLLWQFTSLTKSITHYNRWLTRGYTHLPTDIEEYERNASTYENVMYAKNIPPWVQINQHGEL